MTQPKQSLRRPLAILGATLVGLAAALTVSAPASAHHPVISGSACLITSGSNQGKYEVKWTVANSERDWDATIENLTSPSRAPITNIFVGAKLPKLSANKPALSGVQIVPANKDRELTVEAEWDRPGMDVRRKLTEKAKNLGECPRPTPSPTKPTPTPTKPTPTPTVSATTPPATTPPATTPPATTPPASTPPATPTPTPPVVVPEPGEPTFELQETCDKLTFLIENPADGVAFTVTLTSEKGVVKELKAEPGKTTSVSFDAYPGLKVTPSADGVTDEPVVWAAPSDCGGTGGGSDDELALTGAAAGGIAGGAAVLLAIGAVLFIVFRRRRVRFTA